MGSIFLLISVTLIGSTLGGSLTSWLGTGEDGERAVEFARRSIMLGFDLAKRTEVNRRAFEQRSEPQCSDCLAPQMPAGDCPHGYTPAIVGRKDSECSCITAYECCSPPPCPSLTDDDWKKCDNEPFGVGRWYPSQSENCCDCPVVVCLKCPIIILSEPPSNWGNDRKNTTHKYFWCDNECDKPVKTETANGCGNYICKRKAKPEFAVPECLANCQVKETQTDSCGFNKEVCQCRNPPQCTPVKPKEIDCHTLSEVPLDYYGCNKGGDQCIKCTQWKYDLADPTHTTAKCKACEMEKVRDDGCGSYTTLCQCRTPTNCQPPKPAEVACHTIEKVLNADEESSMCIAADNTKCDRCYSWKLLPIKFEPAITPICDRRCEFLRPKTTQCGSEQECACISKTIAQCQPPEPVAPACYISKKKLVDGSFMCAAPPASGCKQCWTYDFEKIPCDTTPVTCKAQCQKTISQYDECNCYKATCQAIDVPDCRPDKPSVNTECNTEPEKEFKDIYTYDGNTGECIRCYSWKYDAIIIPNADVCKLTNLPEKCVSPYTTQGKCGSMTKNCRTNEVPCANTWIEGDDGCPTGKKKVTLVDVCDQQRDACVNCDNIATQGWSDDYHPKCYYAVTMTVLQKCPVDIWMKKPCPSSERLMVTPCPIVGQKRRTFRDDCDCPALLCSGCPATKKVDIQLILDSSGSIQKTPWTALIEFLKNDFIDAIFVNPDSRLAITKYGTRSEVLQDLQPNVSGDWLNDEKYEYTDMTNTFTGNALDDAFSAFQTATTKSDSAKILVVITDGVPTFTSTPVRGAAKKWEDIGVVIYAIGVGQSLSMDGLQDISPSKSFLLGDFAAAEQLITKTIVPSICGQEAIVL